MSMQYLQIDVVLFHLVTFVIFRELRHKNA